MQVLLEEFEKRRLPVLLKIREKVNSGKQVNEGELDFLEKVIEDAERSMPMMFSYPQLNDFCQQVVQLYQEITAKALENEQNKPH